MEDIKNIKLSNLNGISVPTNCTSQNDQICLFDQRPKNGVQFNEIDSELIVAQKKFRNYFKKKLVGIEDCDDETILNNGMLPVLLQYVEQLEDQNDFLIETVSELEKEAKERVFQMNKRLNTSARSTMECVLNLNQWEKEMSRLVKERVEMEESFLSMQHQVSSINVENNFLKDQNFNLNHDIQALLHIIQHARSTGHWEMDCVTFCEVTPEQVFGPMQPLCSSRPSSPQLNSPRFKHCSTEMLSVSNSSSCHSISDASLFAFASVVANVQDMKYPNKKCLPRRYDRVPNRLRSCSVPALRHFSKCLKPNASKSCSVIATCDTKTSQMPEEEVQTSSHSLSQSSYGSVFRRAYSEPHLFMFGNRIYVYRPCEALHQLSNSNIKDDISLNPCLSINLKLPSDSFEFCERTWGLPCDEKNNSMSSSLPFSTTDQISRDFISLTHSKDFQNSMIYDDSDSSPHRTSFNQKQTETASLTCKTVISSSVQTDNLKSFSIGLQADINYENPDSLKQVLLSDTIEGMTVADINKSIQSLKNNLRKAEDQVSAQIILIQELHTHLNTASKSAEMKDTVLETVEKKLNTARSEAKVLREEVVALNSKLTDLSSELENSKSEKNGLKSEIEEGKLKIDELVNQEKVLQNQKRSLMTQLDAQSDELENRISELLEMRTKLEKCSLQVEQQNQIILSLQNALVQSKRAFDEIHSPKPDLKSRSLHSSRSAIVEL